MSSPTPEPLNSQTSRAAAVEHSTAFLLHTHLFEHGPYHQLAGGMDSTFQEQMFLMSYDSRPFDPKTAGDGIHILTAEHKGENLLLPSGQQDGMLLDTRRFPGVGHKKQGLLKGSSGTGKTFGTASLIVKEAEHSNECRRTEQQQGRTAKVLFQMKGRRQVACKANHRLCIFGLFCCLELVAFQLKKRERG